MHAPSVKIRLNHAGYAKFTSAFLNRVRWFDSGRGHPSRTVRRQ